MIHLPFTLAAYFFNALAVVASKFLLSKSIPDPLSYVFYISAISIVALFALPFTNSPDVGTFIFGSLSTVLWTLGAYFMFRSLKTGDVSRVIPLIGIIMPLILLLLAARSGEITNIQIYAIFLLIGGIVLLAFSGLKKGLNIKELSYAFFAGVFFAFSYTFLREAFLRLDFLSVLVWSRVIVLPFVLFIFLLLRKRVLGSNRPQFNLFSRTGAIFIAGQISGILAELLLVFSISLSIPALVNSLQGTQYVFLLILGFILSKKYPAVFKEKYSRMTLILKISGIVITGIGLYFLAFANNP